MARDKRGIRRGSADRLPFAQACARVMAAALLVACALLLAGCKDTNAVKEIIHDQNAEKVDHESGEKNRVPAADGRFVDEDTGVYEVGGPGVPSLPVNVLYVSSDPETELPAARFFYDPTSTNFSEATEDATTPPQDTQQLWQDVQQQSPSVQQPSVDQDPSPGDGSANTPAGQGGSDGQSNQGDQAQGGQGPGTGDKGDQSGQTKDPQDPGAGPQNPNPGPSPDPEEPGDDDPQVYDGSGKTPEVPEVSTIAAFGQVAVLVQMIGGTDGYTPLVAADDELCASAFAHVFEDEGVAAVNASAFSSDGAGSYAPNIDQIVAAKPDTVLVFNDALFSAEQKKELKRNDISITVMPALSSDTGIMRAAENVAKMLDKATDGRSTSVFQDYKSFHDTLISDVEGVRGYGACDANVYDANMNPKPRTFSAQRFTLLIDNWDFGATYNYRGVLSDAGAGVGLATVGFRTSPISYYLGVAGVVNNAAAIDVGKNKAGLLAPAWQFNPNDLSPSDINFSSTAFSSRLYTSWGAGFTKTTLSKVDTKKLTLRENGFGTETFPVVIVATAQMRDAFIASANATDGIYHPFGFSVSSIGTVPGTLAGTTPVFTVIDENLDTSSSTRALVVNPHGLFSSWLEGSAESFLESAWAANIEQFDSDWGGSAASEVKAFYERFYRYPMSDDEVAQVLGGLSS